MLDLKTTHGGKDHGPHFTDEEAEAPRAEMTCLGRYYGAGQGFRPPLCLMSQPGLVQSPTGSRASGEQLSVFGVAGPVPFLPAVPTQSSTGWVTNLPWCVQNIPVLALKVLLSRKPPPSARPRQTKTVGHLYCTQPSQRLQATRNSERRGWTSRCPSLPNPPHLHTWPHAHLHPGREGIVQRKANSNPCMARLSLSLPQGNATGP